MRAATLYYAGLRALGLPAALRHVRNAAVVLCYHNVVPRDLAALAGTGLHVTQARFDAQMRWLAAHYAVVPLRELLARIQGGKSLQRLAAITFDDAYRGVFDHACPILAELGIPATVFVVSGAATTTEPFWWDHPEAARRAADPASRRWLAELGGDGPRILGELGVTAVAPALPETRPAAWDVIRAAVRAGLDLGAHSATHRALPSLSDAELQAEFVESREVLAHHTGVAAQCFAYPYGLWDARVRNAARAAGYAMALTLDSRLIAQDTDPWAAPRVNIPAGISGAAFEAWITGWSPNRKPRR